MLDCSGARTRHFLVCERGKYGKFHTVGQHGKLLARILGGMSDANISFAELCHMLRDMGFDERIRGSHHVFRKRGIEEIDQPAARWK